MKKFLSTAVALGAIAGLAATASALELKVTGSYLVDGYYINSGNGAAGGGGVYPWDLPGIEDNNSDAWYWHEFRINPTLIVNDKIQMRGDIRMIDSDTVWGAQDDLQRFDGGNLRIDKIWLLYDSPIGKWEIGRRPAGAWMGDFVNSGTAADRIMLWAPAMDNFKAYAFLQKSLEVDAYEYWADDADTDYYEVAAGYVVEGMQAWLGLAWNRDMGQTLAVDGAGNEFTIDTDDADWWRVKGYADFKINDTFAVDGEFDYKWGDKNDGAVDINGFAGIIGVNGNFGDLSGRLFYAYISGEDDDPTEDTAYDVSKGMGADFEPLYILTGYEANVLNGDQGPTFLGTAVRTSGAHLVAAVADFKASEDLTLHGGIGWGQAADTDWLPGGVDEDYGWEFDLGLAYKLYDNLTYELHFGWWVVGDFAEMGAANLETEDIWLLSHHLSMKF
ncbi:MAG: hypothetical protein RBR09_09910 [Desulfobulbaceae bacterium]|jgi:hypothetical protein|nr:hypothetical protein [Desulfobulbaceae bacterium]MDY0351557.1 hypothetical protein [Desulfobulbaceae bacterium]